MQVYNVVLMYTANIHKNDVSLRVYIGKQKKSGFSHCFQTSASTKKQLVTLYEDLDIVHSALHKVQDVHCKVVFYNKGKESMCDCFTIQLKYFKLVYVKQHNQCFAEITDVLYARKHSPEFILGHMFDELINFTVGWKIDRIAGQNA